MNKHTRRLLHAGQDFGSRFLLSGSDFGSSACYWPHGVPDDSELSKTDLHLAGDCGDSFQKSVYMPEVFRATPNESIRIVFRRKKPTGSSPPLQETDHPACFSSQTYRLSEPMLRKEMENRCDLVWVKWNPLDEPNSRMPTPISSRFPDLVNCVSSRRRVCHRRWTTQLLFEPQSQSAVHVLELLE